MNRLNRKLRSRSGASITLALLFFLICAVLCSVIIAAATAAAGRMAQAAEMDQRYYAVTSAGELMKDLIHQKRVTIVTVTTSSATTPYTQSGTGYEAGTSVSNNDASSKTYLIPDKAVSDITATDYNTELNGAFRPPTIPQYAAKKLYNNPTSSPVDSRSFSLSSTTAMLTALGTERDPLAVTIEEELDSDGTITLLVHNTVHNPGDETFTQKMVFDVTETKGSRTEASDGPATYNGAGEYSITTTTTETETRSLIWNLVSVETVSVPVPVTSP